MKFKPTTSRSSPYRMAALAGIVAIAATAACGAVSSPQAHGSQRVDYQASSSHPGGNLVSVVPVEDLQPAEVSARLQAAGFEAARVRYGVTAYRVVYRTVGARGEPTTASQLVALPDNDEDDLRVVSWLHGTTVYRGDVASMKPDSSDRAVALLFASTGRAVSAPDYLGLGEGPGHHTYGDPDTTVSASVDALRAARKLAGQHGRRLDERVLVSGFSQGGPATMLVGRALQEGVERHFELGALAPIAGPFHLSRFEADAADDKVANAALYLAYFTIAWDRLYGLYNSPREAFLEPYATEVETLFDGHHKPQEIAAALPARSDELFTADFLEQIRNPTGELSRRLRPLDTTCDWRPDVPVHIYHASGDSDVSLDHARYCQQQLKSNGATEKLTDVGDVDHNTTVRRAVPQVAGVFDRAG